MRGVTAKREGVSLGGDENVLKLDCGGGLVAQLCKYTKNGLGCSLKATAEPYSADKKAAAQRGREKAVLPSADAWEGPHRLRPPTQEARDGPGSHQAPEPRSPGRQGAPEDTGRHRHGMGTLDQPRPLLPCLCTFSLLRRHGDSALPGTGDPPGGKKKKKTLKDGSRISQDTSCQGL